LHELTAGANGIRTLGPHKKPNRRSAPAPADRLFQSDLSGHTEPRPRMLAPATITRRAPGTIGCQSMLASTKPGSAAAPGREGDGEGGWGDPIGSPLTASARSRRNCSILARIASKSSAARLWARTTMTGNIVDAAEKKTRPCRLALMAAPFPPSDGPARPLGAKMGCRYAGVPLAGPVTWRMRR